MKSLISTLGNFYLAWQRFGVAAKLRADAELLDAISKMMEVNQKVSEFSEEDIKSSKTLLSDLHSKMQAKRLNLLVLIMPFIVFLSLAYALMRFFLEILRIVFL